MRKSFVVAILLLGLGLGALAQEQCQFSGTLGLEVSFVPVPPANLDVFTTVDLGLSFCGVGVESRTVLSLTGLEAEHLQFFLELDGLAFRTGLRFDPCFSKYWFEVRFGCCPFELGGLFLVENLADTCQTPDYTVGIVLDMGLWFDGGFFVRSLTGFGVIGLYYLIDEDPATELIAVPGWWFEEELLQVGFSTECLDIQTIVLFDTLGFAWAQFSASYYWSEPWIELGSRVRLNSAFGFDWAELILGIRVDPLTLRSVTSFDFSGFLGQEIYVAVEFSGIRLYSRTVFDFTGLLLQLVGFEIQF
jgi:hypothetical protein